MVSQHVKERFLRDPLPIRLGGLASDLARIASCADNPKNHAVVTSVLEEGKWFAEWAAPESPIEVREILARVQIQLAQWQRQCTAGRPDPLMRAEARRWADELLELSGLTR